MAVVFLFVLAGLLAEVFAACFFLVCVVVCLRCCMSVRAEASTDTASIDVARSAIINCFIGFYCIDMSFLSMSCASIFLYLPDS